MAGLGKLVKQAEKMKRGIEALQTQLDAKEIDVTAGGGAVKIKINGSGKFLALTLDPEFLKEDPKLIGDTVLAAVQDAVPGDLLTASPPDNERDLGNLALTERQREVLALRYYLDLSEAEIAATLGISRGAVKSHASRGGAALRELLKGDES